MVAPRILNFDQYGQKGTPLVLLHGLFGAAANWRSIGKTLGEQFQVFVPDMRNHGDSPWDDAMDYPAMSADILHFINQHCRGNAHVLGHSMGGKAAMQLALQHPDSLQRLIIADIAPVTYHHSHREIIQALLQLDLSTLTSRANADRLLKPAIPEQGLRLFLLQNLKRDNGKWRWRINLETLLTSSQIITGFPDPPNTWQFTKPCLFLRGEKSDYITASHHSAIEQYFPNMTLKTLAAAGHWLHAEQPKAFVSQVTEFLSAE